MRRATIVVLLFAEFGFGQSFTVSRADDDVQQTKRVEIRTSSPDKHYYLQVACTMSTLKQSKAGKLFVGDSNNVPTDVEVHSDSRLLPYEPSPQVSAQLSRGVEVSSVWDKDEPESSPWIMSSNLQSVVLALSKKRGTHWLMKQLNAHSTFSVSLPHPDTLTPNVQTFDIRGIGEEMSKHEECK